MRAPDWTIQEIELLLNHSDLSSERLAELLPGRTVGAVEAVRNGIHRFHTTGDGSMLSEVTRRYFSERKERPVCPVCKVRLD